MTALGVGPGDRVAVALPNCPQHVVAVTAILCLGAAVVEHNPLYTAAELALDPEGLKTFARQRLTRYKVPRDFYHFERLERDQTGKIRRREVRDTLLSLLTQP